MINSGALAALPKAYMDEPTWTGCVDASLAPVAELRENYIIVEVGTSAVRFKNSNWNQG